MCTMCLDFRRYRHSFIEIEPKMILLTVYVLVITTDRVAWSQRNIQSSRNVTCVLSVCSCCLESALCSSHQQCGGICQDGYHGGKCVNNCPDNCVSCQDIDNPKQNASLFGIANCTQCLPGYYSTPNFFQCQFSYCKNGTFLSGTECLNCSVECSECISETTCTLCKTGFYLSNGICSLCPPGCFSCTSMSQCTECNVGYFQSDGGVCSLCNEACSICTSQIHCTECMNGFYLSDTGNVTLNCRQCSVGCIKGTCNKTSGICQCKDTFIRDMCDRCVEGRFGVDCFMYCPVNCRLDHCDKITGACLGGCFGDFSGDRCCLEGPGCKTCASEYLCADCVIGKHGQVCDKDCPEDCESNLCYKDTGVCHAVRKPDVYVAFIGGGVAFTLVVSVVVIVLIIFCRRRCALADQNSLKADATGGQSNNLRPQQNEIAEEPIVVRTEQTDQCRHHTVFLNLAYHDMVGPETDPHMYDDLQDQMDEQQ